MCSLSKISMQRSGLLHKQPLSQLPTSHPAVQLGDAQSFSNHWYGLALQRCSLVLPFFFFFLLSSPRNKVYPWQIWLTDLSQVTAVLINPHHIDYIRRSGREKSVHSHTDLLCHTFMTVANRICHESQVLCQAEKLSTQDSEWTGCLFRKIPHYQWMQLWRYIFILVPRVWDDLD